MNKVLCVTALCLGVLVLGTPSNALAMDPSVAKVPFPFIVGGTELPAGDYRVSDATGMADVVQITSTDGHAEALAMVEAGSLDPSVPPGATVFKFKKVGNDYYLASVTVLGEATMGFAVPRTASAIAVTTTPAPVGHQHQ